MKERYEVLKQIRLCLGWPIDTFTQLLGFSSVQYVQNVESGNVKNVEYIYERYAKVARIKSSTIRLLVSDAEKKKYTADEIAAEVRKLMRID